MTDRPSARPGDFAGARRSLRDRPRAGGDKLADLDAALEGVSDGDHIAIGGCLYSRTPYAALTALLRRRPSDLTLSRSLMCWEGELYLAAGASRHLVTSWMAIGLPWGISRPLRNFVEGGRARFEEWSHLALGLRYKAGAMGVPFLPTLTMLGSDLHRHAGTKEIVDPFSGETVCLVPALYPDVALIHVHRADRFGNAQIDGYPHMDADIARAARTVIVTTEEIVEPEVIAADGAATAIPGFAVDAVVEVPYGAFPHEMYGSYDADFDHFGEYVASSGDEADLAAYLDRTVYGVTSHDEFLAGFPAGALERARARAREVLE